MGWDKLENILLFYFWHNLWAAPGTPIYWHKTGDGKKDVEVSDG